MLRSPGGCPWDIKQTHESLKRNAVEEACEVCDAIDEGSMEHLREELGDLLMQVIFHASIEKEKGGFDLDDVSDEAVKKLVHRHPHVFADAKADTPDEVLANWDAIKRADRGQQSVATAMDGIPQAACPGSCARRRYRTRPPSSASTGRTSPARWTSSARRSASSRRV